jgi:hypothetical protein
MTMAKKKKTGYLILAATNQKNFSGIVELRVSGSFGYQLSWSSSPGI